MLQIPTFWCAVEKTFLGVPVGKVQRTAYFLSAVLLLIGSVETAAQSSERSRWQRSEKPPPRSLSLTTSPTLTPKSPRPSRILPAKTVKSPKTSQTSPTATLTTATLDQTSPILSPADRGTSPLVEPDPDAPVWRQITPPNPPAPRFKPLMVYEPDRQRTLLFGGFLENNQYCNETWEFDGRAWKRLDIPAPLADAGYAMAYDSYRGVAVLFGGGSRETWEFDGSKWNRVRSERRPPIIGGGAMAYDPNRHVTLLFGGEVLPSRDSVLPVLTNETWQYDGYDWAKLDIQGSPSARKYHQMVYDLARERFVVFGGFDGKVLNDTWELRLSGWRRVETREAPSARRGFALTYDPIHRQVLLFGGFPGGDEFWAFDGAQWSRIMVAHSPSYREGAGLVFVATTRRALLFGGLSLALLNDAWEFARPKPQMTLLLPPPPKSDKTEVEAVLSDLSRRRAPRKEIIPPILERPSLGPESDLKEVTTRSALTAKSTRPTTRSLLAIPPSPTTRTALVARPTPTQPAGPNPFSFLPDFGFKNVAISSTTLTCKKPVSITGSLVNTGGKDARCWLEIWLSTKRDQLVHEHLLCPAVHVEVKANQSFDLSQLQMVADAGIPPGQYYIAFEADRSDEIPEQNERNNVWMLDPLYTISAK